tara:strand:- start:1389 stop:1997 length:609 start_codon:yes stop_codon:yes gene_type:complete
MERNNESSLNRQRQRRQYNQDVEDIVDPVTRQNIDDAIQNLKDYQSSGRMDSTSGKLGARAVGAEIERLEGEKRKAQDRLDRDSEEDRKRGGAGKDASTRPGGTLPTFDEREADAGLTDTMSGRGQSDPTMDEREAAAGLHGTTTGRDFSDETGGQTTGDDGELPDEKDNDDPLSTFGVIICINGRPHSASIYGQIGPNLGD